MTRMGRNSLAIVQVGSWVRLTLAHSTCWSLLTLVAGTILPLLEKTCEYHVTQLAKNHPSLPYKDIFGPPKRSLERSESEINNVLK